MAFDWFKKKSTVDSESKDRIKISRPVSRDWTEDMVANSDMLKALYHNIYPGLKLAGSLAFPAISVPVYFMGLPIPTTGKEEADKELIELHKRFITDEQQLHIHCHREGTIWIWPKFNENTGFPMWEFMPDDSVEPIKDIETGDIKALYTDEQLTISTGRNERKIVRRIREFTEQKIKVRYEPLLPGLKNLTYRNNLRIFPIPFTNNADAGNVRGYSDLTRILSDLKMYHDTELAQHVAIAQFRPKIIQTVQKASDWISQNGLSDDLSDLDVSKIDFIFNLAEKEKTEFISLASVVSPYIDSKKQTFKKLVQGSGVPEICWGLKTEGNNASVEESMGTLANYVDDKKRQKQESYDRLWSATLKLARRGTMNPANDQVTVKWDDMETVSEVVKSEIFKNFGQGLNYIASSATGTKAQLWEAWKKFYPGITKEDEAKFIKGIKETADHKVYTSSTWSDLELGMGRDENSNS